MRPWIVVFAPALLFPLATAAATKTGQQLHDERCAACHVRQVGGDGSAIYTRPEHKIKTLDALRKRVEYCVNHTDTSWFPEEQEAVVGYLNQRFYKFK